jgi:hypothetical protein
MAMQSTAFQAWVPQSRRESEASRFEKESVLNINLKNNKISRKAKDSTENDASINS